VPNLELERFTALYEEQFPHVWAYVVSRTGRQVAEEVVSDTFAVAWRRRTEIPTPALPWLLGVARNVLRTSYRSTARQGQLAAELRTWSTAATASEPDVAEGVVERAAVLRALAGLPDADREILTLVAWQGLATEDAARVLGCSRTAFAVRLHRARRRLERALRQAGESPEDDRRPADATTLLTTGTEMTR
jgi:RNA polymerase sigma factor (sigma-70 family)